MYEKLFIDLVAFKGVVFGLLCFVFDSFILFYFLIVFNFFLSYFPLSLVYNCTKIEGSLI